MQLIVVRHAKSSWSDLSIRDHDRALARRGIEASPRIGSWLNDRGFCPEVVMCSTARRAVETWELISRQLPEPKSVYFVRALYGAGHDTILDHVRLGEHSPLLVVGHNPGIMMFAGVMLQKVPNHPKFYKFPTGATMVCDLPVPNWRSARMGIGKCRGFVVPRELS
ncbi:MAG: histidine phosphatase family protein [Rhodobacteraceae bacterium]|nr:histidine phosphatase family protein [Paracoccaceae bacterium]